MSVFEALSNNKGTVSSKLGKALAKKVLEEGQSDVLAECIDLSSYQPEDVSAKNIRAGAAKVVEIMAEKRPELVAPRLQDLLPALTVEEPQTRWMTIRTFGFCAYLDKAVAQKAIPYARKYIEEKEGLIIASSTDLFLGDYGALSKEATAEVYPLLEKSMETAVTNEADWLLEALYKIFLNLGQKEQEYVRRFAHDWQNSARKSTQKRARRILRLQSVQEQRRRNK